MKAARRGFSEEIAKKAKRLRKRLLNDEIPDTLASSRYMRDVRLRVCGQLWRMIEAEEISSARFFTIIPRGWEIDAGDLPKFCPRQALHRFRRILNLYEANAADGFFYAVIHGAFDPVDQKYRLHLHGIASGKMVKVVRRLRKTRKLKSAAGDYAAEKVRQRVRVERREIDNLPRVTSYTFKSFWPLRITSAEAADGPLPKSRKRIEEPQHTEYLLWLDRYQPEDIVLTIGLSASRYGLKISKRRVQ